MQVITRGDLFDVFARIVRGPGADKAIPFSATYFHSVPLAHLYWHLLMWQDHLDQAAADHERSGEDGAWLRTYLQKKLGFNDDEFKPVRQSAERLQATLAGLDAEAHVVVKQQQVLRNERLLPVSDLASGVPELRDLSQQREAAINRQIAQMNAALGPVNSERLKMYVLRVFAGNVRVATVRRQGVKP